MMEEWPDGESAESFARRRFAKDKLSDLALAVKIMGELETADEIAADWFASKDATSQGE
jgi:hypothetical protein